VFIRSGDRNFEKLGQETTLNVGDIANKDRFVFYKKEQKAVIEKYLPSNKNNSYKKSLFL